MMRCYFTLASLKLLQSLLVGKATDLWPTAQYQPAMFKEGGEIYEMAKEGFGEKFKDGTHFTVPLFPDKVFRVNKQEKCLELCLGLHHIPVRPLTEAEKEKFVNFCLLLLYDPQSFLIV